MIATLKLAGVAGFEPTNDGVRGSMGEGKSGNFCAKNCQKTVTLGRKTGKNLLKPLFFKVFSSSEKSSLKRSTSQKLPNLSLTQNHAEDSPLRDFIFAN